MPVALRDLVGVAALALRPRTGELGLDRLVRWVAPTELADPTPWMDGGELILTTGLRLRGAAVQSAFVERLAAAGAAGIGFGTGLSHNAVPRALLVAAHRGGLPVVEVPYETPFIAIARHVADQLAAEHFSDQRRLVDEHDRLTQAVLAGDGLEQLVRSLSRQTGTRVAVLLADGGVLAGQRPAEVRHDLGIDVDSVPAARLVAGPTTHPEPLPYAARLAGLELARRLSFLAGRRFLLGRLLRDLFDGRLRGEGVEWLLAAHGVHPQEPYCALVGGWADDRSATAEENLRRLSRLAWSARQFEVPGPAVETARAADAAGGAGAEAVAHADDAAGAIGAGAGATAEAGSAAGTVSAVVDRQLLVLVPGRLDVEAQARALLEALRLDPLRGPEAAVGIGAPRGGAVGLEHGYLEARTAASRGPGVHRAAPLTLSDLLLSRPDPAVRGLSEQILAPLARFDAEHNAGLVETLRRFLATDGSVHATAEQLFVHRNTVRYRLDQVEKLTGRTLSATTHRTELWLALLTRDGVPARSGTDARDAHPRAD